MTKALPLHPRRVKLLEACEKEVTEHANECITAAEQRKTDVEKRVEELLNTPAWNEKEASEMKLLEADL